MYAEITAKRPKYAKRWRRALFAPLRLSIELRSNALHWYRLHWRKNSIAIESTGALSRTIVISMVRSVTTRASGIGWLLCVVLTCLAVDSPHCDLCNGPFVVASSSSKSLVNRPLPISPKPCNGICWCCGFHGLPNLGPVLNQVNAVTADIWPDFARPVLAPRSPIFRPPRIAVPA